MTTPIDLDLVELRCKLRGLTYQRLRDELTFRWGSGQVILCQDGEHMLPFYGAQYSEAEVDTGLALVVLLTRPRLTLADIVASPPEGWRVERVNAGLVRFHFDAALISVEWRKGRIHETWLRTWALNMDQRLAAHRAVTDLLIRLAEVEPRA